MFQQDTNFSGESKTSGKFSRKIRWRAFDVGVFEHPVVGMHIKTPKAADPERHAQQPTLFWLWMIREAAWAAREEMIARRPIRLKRGQLAGSQSFFAEKANWTRKAWRVFLGRIEKFGMVETCVSEPVPLGARTSPDQGQGVTIITICNYDKFQHAEKARGQGGAKVGPTRGQAGARKKTLRHKETPNSKTLHQSPEGVNGKQEQPRDEKRPSGIDAASGERLPFTPDTIRELVELDLNEREIDDLVAAYRKQAKTKAIGKPDAYLLKAGRNRVAQKTGMSVATLKKITSRNQAERVTAMANVVGAFSRPSESVLERSRKYRNPHIDRALERMKGKTFTSQSAADRAFRGELTTMHFERRVA